MVCEGVKELVLKKKSRQVTGSKLRIYELKDSGMLANCPPSPFGEGRGEAFFPHSVVLKYNGVSRLLLPSPFGEGSEERL